MSVTNPTLAAELINDNGISGIALAFFTALFGMVGTIAITMLKIKSGQREAKNAASEAAHSAKEASKNTVNVGNGFVNRMDRKLDLLAVNQDRLEQSFQEHLEWHLKRKE